ncbi:N-6 DNA methylase [Hymenobacter sp. BT491]|uniref:N-6 DNA methylase n=1 Tax=Hymenobacter sp. BT491 TaxID=2766779 RepID=UPI001CA3CFB8|nr:N-6 DNA methylase [Hymenobacter sp. BT491]
MDDMDAESEELNGKRTFFAGPFARFGWAQLMAPSMGGQDVLNLYSEAIAKMNENPGVPTLFRDIFKNAYLPYRDPETLRAFLKEINAFSYDHSERLGDAFEYLLSVLGAQGDAGQFRTPRHLIDFLVQVLDPQKHETVLDPACGTAGFLISAYKHILAQNQKQRPGDRLTPDERARLVRNFQGYDISPDMVRLSLANLYLHGFPNPAVEEYDTLTSEAHWNDTFDVILANPPFMSPKGGIKPHKRFSMPSNRSEVLFVDYIAEHLTPQGRAAIIVPEGIIFQSGTAYRALRKMLVKQSLVAVVSFPAGVFQPYSGVKTSVLILDKRLATRTDEVLFVRIQNDGFGLGAQRRETTGSDLPAAAAQLRAWFQHLGVSGLGFATPELDAMHRVSKARIGENGDWNLSGERYRVNERIIADYPFVELEAVCKKITDGSHFSPETTDAGYPYVTVRDLSLGVIDFANAKRINSSDYNLLVKSGCRPKRNDILFSKDGTVGKAALVKEDNEFVVLSSLAILSPDEDIILPEYLFAIVSAPTFVNIAIDNKTGVAIRRIVLRALKSIEIPLPPITVQREIVAEIAGYQRVIDGARQVLTAYQPRIAVDAAWPVVELGEVCSVKSGGTPSRDKEAYWNGQIPWVTTSLIKFSIINEAEEFITAEGLASSSARIFPAGTVLMAMYGQGVTRGRVGILGIDAAINQACAAFVIKDEVILPNYLYYVLASRYTELRQMSEDRGGNQSNLSAGILKQLQISLPDLATQRRLVAAIEAEQRLVAANRELINLMEQRVRATIGRVWGASVPSVAEPAWIKA